MLFEDQKIFITRHDAGDFATESRGQNRVVVRIATNWGIQRLGLDNRYHRTNNLHHFAYICSGELKLA